MTFQTEFAFLLPRGDRDADGTLHHTSEASWGQGL